MALLLRKHFGSSVPTDSKLIFLNKVAGEDRSDEIVVDGKIIGTHALRRPGPRSSPSTSRWTAPSSYLPVAKKGIVTVAKLTGHLKGKKIPGQEIVEIKGDFSEGDPLIVVSGNTLCSAVAKVGSDQARTAEKAILIRDVGKVEKAPFGKRASRQDFVAANRGSWRVWSPRASATSSRSSATGSCRSPFPSAAGRIRWPATASPRGQAQDSPSSSSTPAWNSRTRSSTFAISLPSTTNNSSSPRRGTRSGSRWTPSGRRPRTSAGAARSASWVR